MKKIRKISLGTYKFDLRSRKMILDTLKSGRLSPGPITEKFEKKFAAYHDAKFGIFSNSGTSALQIALHALKSIHNWPDNSEVLVPAITFIATSNIVISNRMKPVFVDVDPETYLIDPSQIEKHITDKTKAIIPVHLFGLPADMDPIIGIAKKHGLKVIEDSCECMGVKYKNRSVGSLGDIGCFSTYVAHLIVTGVGGLSITNNPEYATKMKSLMNHGRDSIYLRLEDDDKLASGGLWQIVNNRFSFVDVGYSYRATELEAALGIFALDKLKSQLVQRKKNAEYLIKNLSTFGKFMRLPKTLNDRGHAFMMFPITLNGGLKRDDLIMFLEKNGIETRYAMPLLTQPVYKKMFGKDVEKEYPMASYINYNSFYIGCHHDLSKKDLDHVIRVFSNFFENKNKKSIALNV